MRKLRKLLRLKKKFWLMLSLISIMLWQFGSASYILAKAHLAQYLLKQAWQETLSGKREVKPWSWADTWPVARLRVPNHKIDQIVLSGDSGRNLAFGPGYRLSSSSFNKKGIAMISAHRDTHFSFLQKVKKGERIIIQNEKGQNSIYEIVNTKITNAKHAAIPIVTSGAQLSLVTCYPFNAIRPGGPLRFVVSAKKVF